MHRPTDDLLEDHVMQITHPEKTVAAPVIDAAP